MPGRVSEEGEYLEDESCSEEASRPQPSGKSMEERNRRDLRHSIMSDYFL